jgi:hypothetical protein
MQDFDEKNKIKFNDIKRRIKSKININYLDENYMEKYFRSNYKLQNYKKNIDIDDLSFVLEFKDEIQSQREKEDIEYQKFLTNLLIESFNNSYYNFSNQFLKQQIVNNLNISINYKIEVLIDYIIEKIKKEYNYYSLLLDQTDELGKTSKIAVTNLYLDFNNNLNEIINEFVENIFDLNLPIFYQDIKNTFRNNFLNYYYKEENEYNIKIFNLNKYFKEIILNDTFNNSLNSLSDTIINKVINEEIKQTINNLINTKIKSLKELISDISKNISKILNNKFENSINENMTKIYNLIVEYSEIIKRQNNKFIFEPNDNLTSLSDDFFINILGPPLTVIKEKYNSIETDLLNQLIELINEFPDFYSIIKNNINVTDKFEILGDIFNEIRNNLTAYGDELNEDFDPLFNKIIHYAYINGLDIYDKSCEDSFCAAHSDPNKIKEKRNLNEKLEIKFNNYSNINKTELFLKRNKNISFKRKLEYNRYMGSLSVDDVILYLFEIQKILYNFNGTYLGEKFIQMNKTMHSYVSIIDDTLLTKLKKSIDKTSSKFLTILTENSYKILEQNIYRQYYEIEAFIHETSNFTKININHFIEQLNSTSIWVRLNFDLIYNRVLNYYKIIHDTIQEKYRTINVYESKNNEYNLRSLNVIDDVNNFFWKFNDTFSNLTSLFTELTKNENKTKEEIQFILDILNINITEFNFTQFNNTLLNIIKFVNDFKNNPYKILKDNLNKKDNKNFVITGLKCHFTFDIPIVSNLKIDLLIFSYITYGYQYELKFDLEKDKFSAYLGSYIESGVNISAELGLSIPSPVIIGVSFQVGIKGIVGSGKLSLGITFDIYNLFFSFNLYFELKLINMEFFIRMKLFFHLLFFNFEQSFSLYKTDIEVVKKVYPIPPINQSFSKDKNILQILNIQ